jgi:hypothetical protein
MTSYVAYIDESGNHDLNTQKQGASRYFVVLAVLAPRSEASDLECAVEAIRKKYFGTGEIKSSNTKNDRRLRIIEDLSVLDFQFYAVAVDKEKIDKDCGLGFKCSFIKFANGKLYSSLFKNFSDITIFADAHGSPEFTDSFLKYINENHTRDLFTSSKVDLVDSKKNVLVQLADFLVGTVARLYEDKYPNEVKKKILAFINNKRTRIDEWPPRFEHREVKAEASTEDDTIVREISLNAAAIFLQQYSTHEDVELRAQHATLSFMLFRATFAAGEEFISAKEIIEHLLHQGFEEITPHYVRSNIISKLRDKDVVIASSSRGYKIPTSYADLFGFAELVDGIALPLLARLKRAHGIFDLGSAGKIKILDEPRFKKMSAMLSRSYDGLS